MTFEFEQVEENTTDRHRAYNGTRWSKAHDS